MGGWSPSSASESTRSRKARSSSSTCTHTRTRARTHARTHTHTRTTARAAGRHRGDCIARHPAPDPALPHPRPSHYRLLSARQARPARPSRPFESADTRHRLAPCTLIPAPTPPPPSPVSRDMPRHQAGAAAAPARGPEAAVRGGAVYWFRSAEHKMGGCARAGRAWLM